MHQQSRPSTIVRFLKPTLQNYPPTSPPTWQEVKPHIQLLTKCMLMAVILAAPNSRSTARSKLTRLTIQQFHELSTDVYDELVRRKNGDQGVYNLSLISLLE